MSPPPSKRRRVSSPRIAAAAAAAVESSAAGRSPPTRTRSRSRSRSRSQRQSSSSSESPPKKRKNPLEGFNESDEEDRFAGLSSNRNRGTAAAPSETVQHENEEEEEEEEHCAICLSPIENRAVVSPCHHGQFCWGCIRAWTDQSRKCPLCLGPIEHLIHNIRSTKDYQVHYLLPLHAVASTSTTTAEFGVALPARARQRNAVNPTLPRHALYGRSRYSSSARVDERDETTWREREEERALERRRYIYREGLYAKHVASNRYTGFKPFTPQTFANNADLKAKVIKFIRRELQVFPAVDVAFLTTYLVSIASQLDLRSPSAIRLISDFLSDQDAQHLVHEISTFARSPFTSLEGYDRFVQYGRPQREAPKEAELDQMVHDAGDLERDAPRFEEHMRRRRAEEDAAERERPKPPPPVSGSMTARSSYGAQGGTRLPVDRGYPPRDRRLSGGGGPRPRSHSPGPPPLHAHRRYSGPGRPRPTRPISPPREPDWRDRGQRYTGPYYGTSESRRDHGRSRRERARAGAGPSRPEPYVRQYERDRSRSRSRERRPRSPPFTRTPALRRSRSPAARCSLSPRPDASPNGHSAVRRRSVSPGPSRDRSRSRTPSRRGTATPSPPPGDTAPNGGAADSELEDAISLVGPTFSVGPASREASPALRSGSVAASRGAQSTGAGGASSEPQLNIFVNVFGAARRVLGNGRVVTLSQDGRASLQPQSAEFQQSSAVAVKKAPAVRPRQQEPYVRPPPSRPASAVGAHKSLLARLGIIKGAVPLRNTASPASSAADSASQAASSTNESKSTTEGKPTHESLRAKLQARLTAEYRQALATRANGASTLSASSPAAVKTDLRSLLQSRLQAEKALAYEDLVRSRAAASFTEARGGLNAAAEPFAPKASLASYRGSSAEPTIFSQATRDLLMARLEEERLLADEEYDAGSYLPDYAHDVSYDPSGGFDVEEADSIRYEADAPAEPATSTTSAKSESSLKAALLAKRQANLEDELKKRTGELKEKMMRQRLMQKRKSTGGQAKPTDVDASARSQV